MQTKGLSLLVIATILAVAAAFLPVNAPDVGSTAGTGEIVLAAFAAHPDAAATIELRGGASRVTLRKINGAWVVAERDNYPADQHKVAAALLGLARLALIEPKTRRPDLYWRLGVEDPAGADAKSVLVRLTNAGGANLGTVIVGRRRADRLGSGEDGTYVRRPDDAQSWLAAGAVDATALPADWLDRSVAAIPQGRIRSITTVQPDGTTLTLSRAETEDELKLPDAPADAKYTRAFRRNDLAGVLDGLTLTDVAAAFRMPDHAPTVKWTSFDGLVITGTLVDKDGAHWMQLTASAADDNARDEARKLNATWSRWVYAIPDAKAEAIGVKRSDILQSP